MVLFVAASTFNLCSHAKHIDMSQSLLGIAILAFVLLAYTEQHQININEIKIWWQQMQCELPLADSRHTLICILWLKIQKASLQFQPIMIFCFKPMLEYVLWMSEIIVS